MRYPGGKGRLYQNIINLMPPHQVYVELYLGGGAVLRAKAPAMLNIGVDIDPSSLNRFTGFPQNYLFVCRDALEFLGEMRPGPEWLIYCDPPYLPETRRAKRVYRHDYTRQDHEMLLSVLMRLTCTVMISGYENELYRKRLADWHVQVFAGTSHVGSRNELVWMNFKPGVVHETGFLGGTFRERQSVKRKRARWRRRFGTLDRPQQQAILTDLFHEFCEHAASPLHPNTAEGR
jgi:site-specific DNA-adenine methylase